MQPDDEKSNQPTLEEFRVINNRNLIERGVEPPKPGSDLELQQYHNWLRGREKLRELEEKLSHGTNA